LAVPTQATAQRPASVSDTLRLSIEEAVSTGLRVGDEVRLANAQAAVADAQLDTARASLLPQFRVNAGYTRTFESARATAVNQVFNEPNTYTVTGNFTQPLFQGGRLYATARA